MVSRMESNRDSATEEAHGPRREDPDTECHQRLPLPCSKVAIDQRAVSPCSTVLDLTVPSTELLASFPNLFPFGLTNPSAGNLHPFRSPARALFFVGLLYYSWRVIFLGAWATEAVNGTPGPVRTAKAKVIALRVSVLGWQGRL